MSSLHQSIENLVFKGGGTKGSAYAGCIEVLEDRGLLAGVKRISGTSAGAITATIVALGGGSVALTNSVKNTNFAQFLEDYWGFFGEMQRTVTHFGMHTGHEFVAILKSTIAQLVGSPELTFCQLDRLVLDNAEKYKKLSIIASNLTTQRSQVFNSDTHGDLEIWKAVRASMSIPFLFQPMVINGEYYVDGGLAWNYPIDVYDKKMKTEVHHETIVEVNDTTLGFFLETQGLVDKNDQFKTDYYKIKSMLGFFLKSPNLVDKDGQFKTDMYEIKSIRSFASRLASFLYETVDLKHMHPSDCSRTVFIDDLGISGTNFNISEDQVEALINSGRTATEAYFTQKEPVHC